MNGGETDFFKHRKGLRQGDPLSPMLFNLAVDVLQKMIESLNTITNGRISSKLRQSVLMHQYADDTVLIANNSVTALVTLKIMLRLFTAISGLQINYHKSSWIPINQSSYEISINSAILGCSLTEFPVTYLGLPLTINRPTNSAFMPLIERLESKLEGWKSKLISRGGRLLLMNSVLSAVPIYFMGSFLLPKWVIKRIDRIRRSFLWGQSDARRGISWINWKAVCTPRQYGGMGGVDLEKRNWALLLRWWWKLYRQQESLWAQTIIRIRSVTSSRHKHRVWMVRGSFFWCHLLKLRPFFDLCTSWIIGTGVSVSYWFDNWTVPNMASQIAPLQVNRSWSLQMAANRGLPYFNSLHSGTEDQLQWNLTANRVYTARSFYQIITTAGRTKESLQFTWCLKMPPTVKIFAYLCIQERLLTQDVLMIRGIECDRNCVQCQRCTLETAQHLLFNCEYARLFWCRLTLHLGYNILCRGGSMQQTILNSYRCCRHHIPRSKWGVLFFSACWLLWKERNNKVFQGKCVEPTQVAERALKEAWLWLKFC